MNTQNEISNEVVDNNPTQIVETIIEPNLSKEFLESEQKNKHTEVHKVTFDHIKDLKVKTAEMKIFVFQYNEEIKRLKRNESSIKCKSTKTADKLGLSYEEYRAKVEANGVGGGRANEYQYEEFYQACLHMFDPKLKLMSGLSSDEKLFWMEVKEEKVRYDACLASKKCNMKKKEKALVVETVVETIEPVIEESSIVE